MIWHLATIVAFNNLKDHSPLPAQAPKQQYNIADGCNPIKTWRPTNLQGSLTIFILLDRLWVLLSEQKLYCCIVLKRFWKIDVRIIHCRDSHGQILGREWYTVASKHQMLVQNSKPLQSVPHQQISGLAKHLLFGNIFPTLSHHPTKKNLTQDSGYPC